jgi:hypothetical protein
MRKSFIRVSLFAAIALTLVMSGLTNFSVQANPVDQAAITAVPATSSGATAAASQSVGPALQAGSQIGATTLTRVDGPDPNVLTIVPTFCRNNPEVPGTKTLTAVCDIPAFQRAYLSDGLRAADQAGLDASWGLVGWDIFLDGQQIDLTSFATYDRDVKVGAKTLKTRNWLIELDNLAPGKHTYKSVFKASKAVTDPVNGKLAPGNYTYEATLNVGVENYAKPCPTAKPASTSAATAGVSTPTPTVVVSTGSGAPAYLGISFVYTSCGVILTSVEPNLAAAKAKLKVDDILLAVNGIPLTTLPGMLPIQPANTAGQTVTYTVARKGVVFDVQVTFSERPTPTPVATDTPTVVTIPTQVNPATTPAPVATKKR